MIVQLMISVMCAISVFWLAVTLHRRTFSSITAKGLTLMIIFLTWRPFTPHKVTVQSIQQSQYLWSKLAGTISIRFPLHSVHVQHLQTWWWKSEVASVANAGHRRVIQSERHARRCFGNAKWCALCGDAFKARHRLKWRRLCRLQEAEYKGIKVRGMTLGAAARSQFDAGKRSSCPHENEWQRESAKTRLV